MVPDDQPLPDADHLVIETEAELNALLGREENSPD
jgi:hypothetical protein